MSKAFDPGLRRHLKACGWTPPLKRTADQKERWEGWCRMAREQAMMYGIFNPTAARKLNELTGRGETVPIRKSALITPQAS